jgi:DNA-binding Lrp family transcriptional regulator
MAEIGAVQTAVPLNEVDRNIIAELTRDGRMSVTQVAENVHISRAHAYTRDCPADW